MSEKDFLATLADTIDTETELSGETVLADLDEWDSLSAVSIIAWGNTAFGKKLTVSELNKAVTASDLYKLMVE